MSVLNNDHASSPSANGVGHIDLIGVKILVVGASGFIGLPLVRELVKLRANVTAVSRNPGKRVEPVPESEASPVRWTAGDASNAAQMRQLFDQARPEIVYILASDSRGGPDLDIVQASLQNDVVASINILVEATRHKCRHVIMTASLDEPVGAADTATPSSPYGAAKWMTGSYARMFMRLYGTPISILRPMMTYGPGQKEYKLVPSIVQALLRNQPAALGSGKRLVDWVYIDDVVEAFVLTASGAALNGTIDLGSGQLVSIRDCALLIGTLMGRPHLLEFDPGRDRPYEEVKAADTRAAEERLGWRATTPLREGIQRTIADLELKLATSR